MKTIIAGSRDVVDPHLVACAMVEAELFAGIVPTVVFNGKARGVDTLGGDWADAHGIPQKPFPARWRDRDGTYHPNAGKKRNQDMANEADALVAIWDGESSGTADMIQRALRKKLLVWVYRVSP